MNNLDLDATIELKHSRISVESFCVISGPCVIENEKKLYSVAKKLKTMGVNVLRGGTFKMRTSPNSFQGLGEEGLKILSSVGNQLQMDVVSEITSIEQVELFEQYVDIIMVGMRSMFNYPLLERLSHIKKPIILKRNFAAKISELLESLSYLTANGKKNIIVCERGIRTFEDSTRNTLDLTGTSLMKKRYPGMIVFCDPSHASGIRDNIESISLSSIFAGVNGLLIEVDEDPDKSPSDAKQIIDINDFEGVYKKIIKTYQFYKQLYATKN